MPHKADGMAARRNNPYNIMLSEIKRRPRDIGCVSALLSIRAGLPGTLVGILSAPWT